MSDRSPDDGSKSGDDFYRGLGLSGGGASRNVGGGDDGVVFRGTVLYSNQLE